MTTKRIKWNIHPSWDSLGKHFLNESSDLEVEVKGLLAEYATKEVPLVKGINELDLDFQARLIDRTVEKVYQQIKESPKLLKRNPWTLVEKQLVAETQNYCEKIVDNLNRLS